MEEQSRIKEWFEQTYQHKGFSYLRPLEAYAIYPKLLNLQRGENFLDVACGPGLMCRQALAEGAKTYGIDISDTAIEMARRYVPKAIIQTGNAEQLPFADGSMDAVTCLGSLERMLSLDTVLQEIYRVGKSSARFCFLVRNSDHLNWQLFMKKFRLQNKVGHQSAKSLTEWTTVFDRNRFEITQVLPDQWTIVRWRQMLSLGLYKPDATVVRHTVKPLAYAYEFIFLLQKKPLL